MATPIEAQEMTRSRININDKYEIAHWTARLNVSEQQLRDAVAKVGVLVSDVEHELRNNAWSSNTRKVKQG
jgi:hypothetical protein